MSLDATTWITEHAVRRYCQRIRPGADFREGRLVLAASRYKAVRLPDRTWRGQIMWSVDDPPMRLVTKHDAAMGCSILVTVLEPGEDWEDAREEPIRVPAARLGETVARLEVGAMSGMLPVTAPAPPGKPPKLSKAERRARHEAEVRAAAAKKARRISREAADVAVRPAAVKLTRADVKVTRAQRHAEHEAFIAAAEKRQQERIARNAATLGRCAICSDQMTSRSAWRSVENGVGVCPTCGEGLDEVLCLVMTSEAA